MSHRALSSHEGINLRRVCGTPLARSAGRRIEAVQWPADTLATGYLWMLRRSMSSPGSTATTAIASITRSGKCHFGRQAVSSLTQVLVLHPSPKERGGTDVHTPGSPIVRRRELGALLKALRTERGWTAEQVGERLRFSPSKMSRLETGHRGASVRDINDLCDLYQVNDKQRRRLLELAREGKQRAWWQPLGLRYSDYVGLEAEAASISDFGLGLIPGLLQTADYARTVVYAGAT